MLLAYLTLFAGLSISAVAEFYSIMGLIAIYPAAFWPIVIMGAVLGLGKLTGTVWLKQNWHNAPVFLKTYLLPAVAVLMLITSIGVFGFLSKAHSDQSLISGDVMSKISVYDEKIKTEKENIDAVRKSLKQMDEAVDQVMARSTTEGGADKAVAIRRSQQKERSRLLSEITASQQKVALLTEERAPIAAEVRKVEAEIGPIKYIAAFVYGDNPDANLLEKAVTWVSILIVIVLDPMAVILLLASQYSFEFERKKKDESAEEDEFFDRAQEVANSIDNGTYVAPVYPPMGPITNYTYTTYDPGPDDITDLEDINRKLDDAKEQYEPDDGPLTEHQIEQIRDLARSELPRGEVITKDLLFPEDATPIEQYTENEYPFRGKGLQPSVPLTASYLQYSPEEKDIAIVTGTPEILHTAYPESNYNTSMDERPGDYIEPPVPVKHLDASIVDKEYVNVNGQVYHHKAYDSESKNAQDIVDRIKSTYVQNEEQTESGVWSKIAGKPITEDEYLNTARQRRTNDK